MDRTILHCDLNSFYASVELLDHPELLDKPVAVCGDPESRHGIILAKNELAKQYQVSTAETIWQAQRKCPDLVLLPAHHHKYVKWSAVINQIYERYTDLVEPFSIDECWLDITGSMHLFGGEGEKVADEIRRVVQAETGLTISVGVSFNKVFAKLGSDMKKPNATTVIRREDVATKVWPLPATDMLFVGRAANKTLKKYGVSTIGDIVRFGRGPLVELMGKMGGQLYDYSAGLDTAPVLPAGTYTPPKSIGNSNTFRKNLVGEDEIRAGIVLLADGVAARLRHHNMRCYTLQVAVRDPNFNHISRQKRLNVPVCTSTELVQAAMELLHQCWSMSSPVRLLSVTAQNLVPEGETAQQFDLFDPQIAIHRERREQLERAMDGIRSRYGKSAIVPAVTITDGLRPEKNRNGTIPPGPPRKELEPEAD